MYWVTLIPADPQAPIVRVRLDPTANKLIAISQSQGPVPGVHTLELRRVSHTWPCDANGAYLPIDKQEPMMSENPSVSLRVVIEHDGRLTVDASG